VERTLGVLGWQAHRHAHPPTFMSNSRVFINCMISFSPSSTPKAPLSFSSLAMVDTWVWVWHADKKKGGLGFDVQHKQYRQPQQPQQHQQHQQHQRCSHATDAPTDTVTLTQLEASLALSPPNAFERTRQHWCRQGSVGSNLVWRCCNCTCLPSCRAGRPFGRSSAVGAPPSCAARHARETHQHVNNTNHTHTPIHAQAPARER
jgi:hypothetical protein